MIGTALVVVHGILIVTCRSLVDQAVLAWDRGVSVVVGKTTARISKLVIFRIVGTMVVSDER